MEQRLIDANALEKKILKRGAYKICTDDVVAMIADAPTVDAVQVVRCRECKYAEDVNCISAIWCENLEKYLAYDFFCVDGERRTE